MSGSLEGYYLVWGCSEFDHLGPKERLPQVQTDVTVMEGLFRNDMRLTPMFPDAELLNVPLQPLNERIQEWNLAPGARRCAVVVYLATHGVMRQDYFCLCHPETKKVGSGDLNTATLFELRRLAQSLSGGRIQQLLLILDTCQAAGAVPEVRRVFERVDSSRAAPDELKIHVLATCRQRGEATDGRFAPEFVKVALRLASEAPADRFLDTEALAEQIRSALKTTGQHVEYHQVIDQGPVDLRLPNPLRGGLAAQPLSLRSHLPRLQAIVDATRKPDRELQWLWYAWHEGGMFRHHDHDRGWIAHVERRLNLAEHDLSAPECPVIQLVEGFARLEPDLEGQLHAWQEDWNQSRKANLDLSRERGRESFRKYQDWRKTARLELEAVIDPSGAVLPTAVLVRQLTDQAGRNYWQRDALPSGSGRPGTPDALHRCLKDLGDTGPDTIPIRLTVSLKNLGADHGRQQYSKKKELRQVTPLTLHPAERWGLIHSDDSLELNEWGLARAAMMKHRRDMATTGSCVLPAHPQEVVLTEVEEGRPVIAATPESNLASFSARAWSDWQGILLEARKRSANPDQESYLIHDAPDFFPWNAPQWQLLE